MNACFGQRVLDEESAENNQPFLVSALVHLGLVIVACGCQQDRPRTS